MPEQFQLLDGVRLEDSFLYELYASTRADELALWGWEQPAAEAFLRMQWNAQRQSYSLQFPDADELLITVGGQHAGRCLLHKTRSGMRIVDIALLPQYRDQGVGSRVIRRLMEEAGRSGLPVELHVSAANRARRLYERLGFEAISTSDLYIAMRWMPNSIPDANPDKPG